MNYIKSPLNYVGGKHKLLDQILPLFPENIDTFYDVFTGGANIAANIQANKVIASDIQKQVIEFLKTCKDKSSDDMLKELDELIDKFKLSKTNREGFFQLKDYYNKQGVRNWATFYTLVCYGFNNMIRFNNSGEYNYSFGMNRSSFNPTLRETFIKFIDHLKHIPIEFHVRDFKQLPLENITEKDFVYLDPPYLISMASYNNTWNEESEKELYKMLDELNEKGIKFALSNVISHKSKTHSILQNWSKNYYINNLNYSYSNCNYQTTGTSQEVLITNYLPAKNLKKPVKTRRR